MAESSSSGGKNSEEEEHNEASPSPRGPVSPNTKTSEKRPGIFSSERRRRHLSQEQRRRIEQEIRGGRKPVLNVKNITNTLNGIDWSKIGHILDLPESKCDEISSQCSTDEETAEALVREWLLRYPLASWRRIINELYRMNETQYHTLADSILHYAEELTDTTLTLSNLSTVINLVSNMDNVMDCLSIPLSVKRKIIEHSKDEKQQRDECVYYWRNVSPYSMIGWGFLGGDLHSEGQEAALRAAKKYILWAPEPSLTVDTLSTVLDGVQFNMDGVATWLHIPKSKHNEFKRKYNRRQVNRALAAYFMTHHPAPSWTIVGNAVWKGDEHGALEMVQKLYLKGDKLTEGDIRILNIVLADYLNEHLPELKGRLNGLNLNQDYRPPITKDEVVMFLKEIDQPQYATILNESRGVQCLQEHVFNNIYKNALQDEKHIELQVFRMVLCGIARAGKTTFWMRLTNKDFKPSEVSPSTGAAESHYISAVKTKPKKQESDHRPHMQAEMLFDWQLISEDEDCNREALTIYKHIIESQNPPETLDETQIESQDKPHHELQPPSEAEMHETNYKTHESQPHEEEMHENHDETKKLDMYNKPQASEANSFQPISNSEFDQSVTKKDPTDPIISEIDKYLEELNHLLEKGEYTFAVPNIKTMCHLQDVGGQTAFLELLPTLCAGKALYLLFFNYKDFKTRTDETVQMKGSSKEVHTGIEYDQIDVIMKSLICVSSASTELSRNVALLVGTHVDKVESKIVSDVNDFIYERVKRFVDKPLVYAESGGNKPIKEKLVLKVAIKKNSICKHQPEHYGKVLMDIVENKLKCPESEKLPASWYMFIIILHRIQSAGYSVLRYSHCEHIASKLNIQKKSDLESLLFRLQKVLGIILYFPEVEGLEDIVICDPAFVYKSISDQIFQSFPGHDGVLISQKLKQWGMFKCEELAEHSTIIDPQYLKLDKLIILLKHLGIIAEVEYPDHEDIHREYIIPCVLKDAKEQELEVQIQDAKACSVVPLRIYFDCGFAPMGGFCYLFTKLISNNKTTWKLRLPDKLNDDNNIYWRNKVTFDVNFDPHYYIVTLLSTDEYFEIHIIHFVSEKPFLLDRDGHSICNHVWEAVHNVLENSPNKSLQHYKTACICTHNHYPKMGEHMMKFTRNPPVKTSTASKVEAWCVKIPDTNVEIKEEQPSVMVWFKEPNIVVRGKFDKKVDLYIRDLWHKIDVGRKSPKCQWKLNGDEIEVDDIHYKCKTVDRNNFGLSILRFESEHIGEYQCVILTEEEAIVQPAVVSVAVTVTAESNLQIDKHPESNTSIKCGENVTLSVSAVRAEHYKWKWKAATIGAQVTEISMKANGTNLNIENLNEVYNLTLPYCAKWESIGRELGIPKGSLDATRMNRINSGGVEGCLQEMLAKWLRDSKPKPTWLALNRALESVSGQKKYTTKSDAKYIGADGPNLIINGFSSDDQGEYWCVIMNRHQCVESNRAKLNMALETETGNAPQDMPTKSKRAKVESAADRPSSTSSSTSQSSNMVTNRSTESAASTIAVRKRSSEAAGAAAPPTKVKKLNSSTPIEMDEEFSDASEMSGTTCDPSQSSLSQYGVEVSAKEEMTVGTFSSSMSEEHFFKWLKLKQVGGKDCNTLSENGVTALDFVQSDAKDFDDIGLTKFGKRRVLKILAEVKAGCSKSLSQS